MGTSVSRTSQAGTVQLRYWAAARAAAGVDGEEVDLGKSATVEDLIGIVIARRSGADAHQLGQVLGVCSVLVGDQPTKDRATVVPPGSTLEFLPPFAGG